MTRKHKARLILMLGALSAVSPLSIDMYLPGFQQIANDFHTTVAEIGLTLSSYFFGISIGQLVYGPLLERFGRKPPLLFGLTLYLVASVGCALAPSLEWLIAMRFLQAFGGCVGIVAGRAVVRDLFPVSEIARIFSFLILVMGVAPIVAPTIGGLVVANLGWRAIFYIIGGFALALMVAFGAFFTESKPADPRVSLRPGPILAGYREVLTHPQFVLFTLASALASAGLFAYITSAPAVFMEQYGLTTQQFGWFFGVNALGFISGSQLNRFWLKYSSSPRIALLMAGVQFTGALLLILLAAFGWLPFWAAAPFMFLHLFSLGLITPNTTATALGGIEKGIGNASALIGFTQMAASALASGLISQFSNKTIFPMAGAMLLFAAGCFAILVYYRKTLRFSTV